MKKFVLATVFALASTGVLAKDLSVIRFGVDPTFAPFESKNPDGQLVGFDIDLGNAICAELKVKCVWVETHSTASSRRCGRKSSMPCCRQ